MAPVPKAVLRFASFGSKKPEAILLVRNTMPAILLVPIKWLLTINT